jgi:hypothetical protein
MIKGLTKKSGAEISSPARDDALARKRTSAATFTGLIYPWSNLSTFYLYLPLPCMLG